MKTKLLLMILLSGLFIQSRGIDVKWLDEFDLTYMVVDFGQSFKNKTSSGSPLTISGKIFERGIATMPGSKFLIDLNGTADKFIAFVGVDDVSRDGFQAEFLVLGDKKILWRSGVIKKGDAAKEINLDVKGVKRLALLVTRIGQNMPGGPGFGPPATIPAGGMQRMGQAVDWANARIEYSGTEPKPLDNTIKSASKPVILTPATSKYPKINGAKVYGCTPGKPFLYTIPVSGEKPVAISVKGLPKSLSVDPATGIITGTSPEKGTYVLKIQAKNKLGKAKGVIKIISGNLIALTPPLGWNSWNAWGTKVDEEKVKAAADAFVAKLRDYGWNYINIDDGWQAASRTADGELLPNEKFGDMKRLADYVHSKGLKIGIYSSPGEQTCGKFLGSYKHELQDAKTYARWGMDYLKYDWCSYRSIAVDNSLPELKKPYLLMRDALNQTGRDVVYGLCQYGMGNVSSWGAEVGGNLWRTSGDITDSWRSLKQTGFNQTANAKFVNPGHWNDPDMLVIGEVSTGRAGIHYTNLNPDELYTHMSLWSLSAAPLLIGCNLNKLDDFTLNLITNTEILDVNQDPLGKQAKQIVTNDEYQIWAKDMEDGSKVVGLFFTGGVDTDNPVDLFNWGEEPVLKTMKITLNWADFGISGNYKLRDVWRQKDIGTFTGSYETDVNFHGVVMIKLSKTK